MERTGFDEGWLASGDWRLIEDWVVVVDMAGVLNKSKSSKLLFPVVDMLVFEVTPVPLFGCETGLENWIPVILDLAECVAKVDWDPVLACAEKAGALWNSAKSSSTKQNELYAC